VRGSAPAFWWRERAGPSAFALWPAARVWQTAANRRLARPPRYRPPVPVICVGNFVVGGGGKTPSVLALARVANGLGLRPGILARGYGGRARAALAVDPARLDAALVGDEALLLAAAARSVVAADRPAGARLLVAGGADLILMDDGFQDPSLAKDRSLIAIDAAVGVGNGWTVPSGPLRAALAPQLARADALVVIGDGARADSVVARAA
jgi:tetraacyldisaccharide 4'-kinase